jgi:hypothetical protein
MSRWKSGYDSHQIPQCAQNALTALEEVSLEALSEPELAEYQRLLKLLKLLAARLAKLDPELLSLNSWASFPGYLNQARDEIIAFGHSRNIGHLHNANANVDHVLGALRSLDTGLAVEEFKSVADANAVFQSKIIVEFERVKARGEEVQRHLESLTEAIVLNKARIDEGNKVIEQQKGRLDQSIDAFQKQFSDAQERRINDFADASKGHLEAFSAQSKQFEIEFTADAERRKTEYQESFKALREQSDDHLRFLKEREMDVNKIFGAIGTTAFAGNFKTTADNEARAANVLRLTALLLMSAMIAVASVAFFYSMGHEVDWRAFLFRLGTAIVFAVPAFYAANESSKHRELERLNRKVHLELASIDAYLVLLPEDQRNKIKGELSAKFFGVPVQKEKIDEVSRKDLFGLLTTTINNLTKGK